MRVKIFCTCAKVKSLEKKSSAVFFHIICIHEHVYESLFKIFSILPYKKVYLVLKTRLVKIKCKTLCYFV